MRTQQYQNQKYLTRMYSGTRSFLTQNYLRLPIKAPQFIENTVIRLEGLAYPLVNKLTTIVDEKVVDTTLGRFSPVIDSALDVAQKQVVDRYRNIVENMRPSEEQKTDNSQKKDNKNSNSLFNNLVLSVLTVKSYGLPIPTVQETRALIFGGADTVSNKILYTIETKVQKLANLIKKKRNIQQNGETHQKEQQKNYQRRMMALAQQISELSVDFFSYLKTEVQEQQQNNNVSCYLNSAKKLVLAHLKASIQAINQTIFVAILPFVSQSKILLKTYIETLRKQIDDQQLVTFLQSQIQASKQLLSYQQIRNLQTALKQIKYLEIIKENFEKGKNVYKATLESELGTNAQNQKKDNKAQQNNQEESTKKQDAVPQQRKEKESTSEQKSQKEAQETQGEGQTTSGEDQTTQQQNQQSSKKEEQSSDTQDQSSVNQQDQPKKQDQSSEGQEEKHSKKQEKSPERQESKNQDESQKGQEEPPKKQISPERQEDSPKKQEQSQQKEEETSSQKQNSSSQEQGQSPKAQDQDQPHTDKHKKHKKKHT